MRLATAFLALALMSCSNTPDCCGPPAQKDLVAVNIAADFAAFWDATKDMPIDQRVAAFHRDMEPKFPEFYDPARFTSAEKPKRQDERIAAAINGFPAIREKYLVKITTFDKALKENSATFLAAFPDYVATTNVALVHSLGEMDGGGRTLKTKDGKKTDWLIFGVDVMARVHDFPDESAFFHHELFHTYHHAVDNCETVMCNLWGEGLAVYVSKVLHPNAGEGELLLNVPPNLVAGTKARQKEAFAQLRDKLDSTDQKDVGMFFMFGNDASGLPARRGYYLGLLVAEELGKGRSLKELAHMPMSEAGPLIRAAVEKMAQ